MRKKGFKHTEETKRKMSAKAKGKNNPNWKGKSCYESTRLLMSISRIGIKKSDETKKKISQAKIGKNNPNWKGKSCYESTKLLLSAKSKGENNPNWQGGGLIPCFVCGDLFWKRPKEKRVACSRICKDKHQSVLLKGENGPNWQGGISSFPYSPEFNKWLKTQIKKRDKGKCQNPDCRKNSNHFGVHHIDYDKENTANINLIYTCFSCNSRANFNRPYWKKLYTKIMKRRFPK